MSFYRSTVRGIDFFIDGIGKISRWAIIPLMLLLVYEVTTRRIMGIPHLWTTDISLQIFSLYFLLSLGVGIHKDVHVRIDLFYEHFSRKNKAIFDIATYSVMVIIPSLFLLHASFNYAALAWARHQLTPSICRIPIYPIKTFIPVAFALLLLGALSKVIKDLYYVEKGREF